MSKKREKEEQTLDEKLKMAIVPKEEEPYKVPDNWVWTRLGNIIEQIRGVSYKPANVLSNNNGGIRILRGGNIQENSLVLAEDDVYVEKSLVKDEQLLRKGDIVITSSTGSIKAIGKNTCIKEDFIDMSFGAFLKVVRTEKINKELLGYFFQTRYYKKYIEDNVQGVNINNIKNEHIDLIKFALPPIDEQKRIVNKLDYFFDKIQKVKEIIEEVKEKNEARKESILSKAFTGELTAKWRASNIHSAKELLNKINDEKLSNWEQECQKAEAEGRKKPTKPKLKSIDEMIVPNDEIPYKIPNNWVWTRLEDIASYIQRGKSPKYVDESSIYVISQKCVQWTGFELDKARYTSDEVKYTEERFLKKGDILWNSTGTGTVGRVCTLEEIDENQKMVADSHVTVVRTSDNVISKCILNYLISNNVQNNLDSLTTGSTNQKELTLSSVKNLAIPLPPIEEQKEIVRILDNIFTKENLINELISLEDKIQALEKSILSKAFRGELGTNSKDDIEAMELLKEILQK